MPRYRVSCWNCDEGYIEPVDEWSNTRCDICEGKGWYIVTKLTEDNCDGAELIHET